MSYSHRNGIRIHYECQGDGASLLLLNHIGASRLGWCDEFLQKLSQTFELILPDQRGTGASDKPDVAHSLGDMAHDAIGVLDSLGLGRVAVLGLSLGGAVAQELVLHAPDRVDRLVLVSTFCGWRKSVPPDPAMLERLQLPPGLARKEQIRRRLPAYYSPAFLAHHEDYLVALTDRATQDTPTHSLLRQNTAVQQFDSYDRLDEISCPTLVMHGTADPIIPSENSTIIAGRIRQAKLEFIQGAGHVPMTEQPSEVAELVVPFCTPPGSS